MIKAMPPEDFPPLAPFPELSSSRRDAGDVPSSDPPLLSEAQRQEFARVADSLEGKDTPAPLFEPVPEAGDHFLLTSPADKSLPFPKAMPAASDTLAPAPSEQPVLAVDFLALSGGGPGVDDLFNLQGLAASLTDKPIPAPGPSPALATDPPLSSGDWDLPSFFRIPAPALPPKTVTSPTATVPQPIVGIPAPLPMAMPEPVAATFASLEPKPFGVPPFPAAVPAPVRFPQSSAPPLATTITGPEPDFDEPLTFPVPSTVISPTAPADDIAEPNDRGIGMVLSGALLIVAGMVLACCVPALALEADTLAVSSRTLADVRVSHLHGEMFLCAIGAAACLLLGIGSATLRRWAPPLIHATGWVVLLTVLLGMGGATASMFYLSANETPGDAVPGDGVALFALAGVLGVALPLGLIALFQRPSVSRLCWMVDKKPRWTDRRTVPALMVFASGLMLAVAAFALSIAQAAIPVFGEIHNGSAGVQAWAAIGVLAGVAAGFAGAGSRAGWWLLLILSSTLAVSLFLTFRLHDWRHLFQLPATDHESMVNGVLAAAAMFPPIVILLMTRRAFLQHADTH